ncbi:MAG: hypothetical protein IH989_07665 [Planctomycetes bacterium]|nr:hypothetical protein [Planctomycetota bacterium]
MRSKTWGLLTTAFVVVGGLGVVLAQVSQDSPVSKDSAIAPVASGPLDIGLVVPIPADAVFRPYLVGIGEVSGFAATGSTGSVVYSNRLGGGIYAPGGVPGALVGDDIATLASPGCVLDTLRFRVSGDPLRDDSGAGRFGVDFAFYSGCPGAGGFPVFPIVTETFEDNGDYEVIYKPDPATEIEIPTNAYFGVRFSRSLAGIVVGAPATAGFSADSYDFPGALCDAFFGGFPGADHASFDLEITSRNDCPEGVCSSTCTGGNNAGEFCVRDDCPGGTCTPDIEHVTPRPGAL